MVPDTNPGCPPVPAGNKGEEGRGEQPVGFRGWAAFVACGCFACAGQALVETQTPVGTRLR